MRCERKRKWLEPKKGTRIESSWMRYFSVFPLFPGHLSGLFWRTHAQALAHALDDTRHRFNSLNFHCRAEPMCQLNGMNMHHVDRTWWIGLSLCDRLETIFFVSHYRKIGGSLFVFGIFRFPMRDASAALFPSNYSKQKNQHFEARRLPCERLLTTSVHSKAWSPLLGVKLLPSQREIYAKTEIPWIQMTFPFRMFRR